MSEEEFYKLWEDSTREDILNQYYYDRKDLMDMIDKAIEYIENLETEYESLSYGIVDYCKKELLDILKGSDSNENNN